MIVTASVGASKLSGCNCPTGMPCNPPTCRPTIAGHVKPGSFDSSDEKGFMSLLKPGMRISHIFAWPYLFFISRHDATQDILSEILYIAIWMQLPLPSARLKDKATSPDPLQSGIKSLTSLPAQTMIRDLECLAISSSAVTVGKELYVNTPMKMCP